MKGIKFFVFFIILFNIYFWGSGLFIDTEIKTLNWFKTIFKESSD